jgi:hypothetical protein
MFADDSAITSHHQLGLQRYMDRFSESCILFDDQVERQATPEPPLITGKGEELDWLII